MILTSGLPDGRLDVQGFRHLAVALRLDETDAGLIRYAAALAQVLAPVEVRFTYVSPRRTEVVPPGAPAAATIHDQALREIEARVGAHFTGVSSEVKLFFDVLKGQQLDRLLEFTTEQESDLLLIGHRHDNPVSQSLVRRLAMKGPCSLWVVPDDARPRFERLLVPIDFSDHSADTMYTALSLARLSPASEVLALHVYFDEAHVTYEEAERVLRGHEQEAFERFMKPIERDAVTVTPVFVESSHVADAIHRVAAEQQVDLKVMGTRGRSRSAAVLLGSVTESVLGQSRTPLLVVKHFGAQVTFLQALIEKATRKQKGPQFD